MGYFSNGTEGEIYNETYCQRCIHWRDLDDGRGVGCPVWDAHLIYNYDAAGGNTAAAGILGFLIPRDGIENKECAMFVDAASAVIVERDQ